MCVCAHTVCAWPLTWNTRKFLALIRMPRDSRWAWYWAWGTAWGIVSGRKQLTDSGAGQCIQQLCLTDCTYLRETTQMCAASDHMSDAGFHLGRAPSLNFFAAPLKNALVHCVFTPLWNAPPNVTLHAHSKILNWAKLLVIYWTWVWHEYIRHLSIDPVLSSGADNSA